MTDEEAIEKRVRDELYTKAVGAVVLRLHMAEVYGRWDFYSSRVEELRNVAHIMAQFASELLGVSTYVIWAEARKAVEEAKG